MKEQLEKLSDIMLTYHNTTPPGHVLVDMLKNVTTILFFLEKERAGIHDQWQSKVHALTKEGSSVSRAENEAHVEYPEMYMLRHIMTAGYRVADAMRSNISYLKSEMNHA